jgi:hypothetical protein
VGAFSTVSITTSGLLLASLVRVGGEELVELPVWRTAERV